MAGGQISDGEVLELGSVIETLRETGARARTDDTQITVADLTGVAVQDVQIASAVYAGLTQS